jgi:hypothetical protein
MPELTELPQAARRIDDAVFRTVMHILGHHPDAFPTGGLGLATRARVFLPISSGGFGFTSCEFTRHAAYVASVLLCAPHINNTEPLVPGGDAAVGPAADWATCIRGMTASLAALRSAEFGGAEPDSLANRLRCNADSARLSHASSAQLQSNLTKHRDKAVLARLLNPANGAPPAYIALLRSATDRHAGAWMLCSGGHPLLRMHNVAFRDACNMRLSLPLVGSAPPPPGSGLVAAFNSGSRTCSGCGACVLSTGMHAFARVACPHALHPMHTHAHVAGAVRGHISSAASDRARLVGPGLEGGDLNGAAGWTLKVPLQCLRTSSSLPTASLSRAAAPTALSASTMA